MPNEPITQGEIDRARAYIAASRWQNAKSYEATAPHSYTVRKWRPDAQAEFEWMAGLVRRCGYPRKWYRSTHIYLELDGFKYWTMGAPIPITIIINRAILDALTPPGAEGPKL